MVYRGKPSAACGECRKRRNRCDLVAPACGQCVKANRQCPGYRNVVDLMFFDESSKVVAKSTKPKKTTRPDPPEDVFLPETRLVVSQRGAPVRLSDVIFYQPADDIALNFFMSNYIGNDHINSQFQYMPDLFNQYGGSHPGIRESINAVGMAGYSKAARRPEMMKSATMNYISAIQAVNMSLSKPELAGLDTTLASVILLAMFEVMAMPKKRGMSNLTKHLNGAISVAALLVNRKQQTDFGLKLLKSLCQAVIMNSWVQNVPLPDGLVQLKKYLSRVSDPDLHSRYLDIVIMLIEFRHKTNQSPSSLMAEALALDDRLRVFGENMPEEGRFKSLHNAPKDELTFDGYYHIYPRNFTAHFWNNMRSSRMRLHASIISQCRLLLSLPERSTKADASLLSQINISKDTIHTLAIEICATIPQLAGYLPYIESNTQSEPPRSGGHPPGSDAFNEFALGLLFRGHNPTSGLELPQSVPSLAVPRPASQYHLLFQLHRLTDNEHLSEDMRTWIENRIQWIQGLADPQDLQLLQTMLGSAPSGAFPYFVNSSDVAVIEGTGLVNLAFIFSHSWGAVLSARQRADLHMDTPNETLCQQQAACESCTRKTAFRQLVSNNFENPQR